MGNSPKDAPQNVAAAIASAEAALAELKAVTDPGVAAEVLALRARAAQKNFADAIGSLAPVIAGTVDPGAAEPLFPVSSKILDVLHQSGLSPRSQRVLERVVEFSKQATSQFRKQTNGSVETIQDLERVPQSAVLASSFPNSGPKTIKEIVTWAARHGVVMPERPKGN